MAMDPPAMRAVLTRLANAAVLTTLPNAGVRKNFNSSVQLILTHLNESLITAQYISIFLGFKVKSEKARSLSMLKRVDL
jgi:hypothetical protein